ncbi:MAG: hypothetical protein Q7R90_03930 [bacterium]|nr:hypothetical protein [bacterium]
MISKRNLMYLSLTGVVIFFVSLFSKEVGICPSDSYSYCLNFFDQFTEILLPVFGLFLLSPITYWMREDVYETWFRFARWALPLSMFLIFITPEYGGGLVNPIQKGSVSFLLTILFFIISLVIIVSKFVRFRR